MGLVFSANGTAAAVPLIRDGTPALFDKWFEERETQAAESWRIRWTRERSADRRDSGDLCVSSHHHDVLGSAQAGSSASRVKVPVTQRFLGETSKPPESNFST
jgi:hypothetical protein